MPFLMSFALEHEIVTFAWIDNASVQFPLNIYATKAFTYQKTPVAAPHFYLVHGAATERGWSSAG